MRSTDRKNNNSAAPYGATRRELLRALAATGAAGILAGCDLLGKPQPAPFTDPLLDFLGQTRTLLAAYDAVIAANSGASTTLTPLRDAHAAHLEALTALIRPPSASATPTASAVATTPTLAALKTMERTAAASAYETCLAVPAWRATLLGEIAAARATHVKVLG